MNDPKAKLTGTEIRDAGLDDWRVIIATLQARYRTGDFATGLALADRIGAAAEEMNHHPDLLLTYPSLTVTLTSHDVGGITSRDVELAALISEFAAAAGVEADPGSISQVEWALDTADTVSAGAFWAAITGWEIVGEGELQGEISDPHGRHANLWFQPPDAAYEALPGEPDQRWHPDIWVAADEVEGRIERTLAAGGTMVDDSNAPRFWVLADGDGNRACICAVEMRP